MARKRQLGFPDAEHIRAAEIKAGDALEHGERVLHHLEAGRCTNAIQWLTQAHYKLGEARAHGASIPGPTHKSIVKATKQVRKATDRILSSCVMKRPRR